MSFKKGKSTRHNKSPQTVKSASKMSPPAILNAKRASEEKIKHAILDPAPIVRSYAVRYFHDARSTDSEIVPLVIKAIDEFGDDRPFRLLPLVERLVQTPDTLHWLINKLDEAFDRRDESGDEDRLFLGSAIVAAPLELLRTLKPEIDRLKWFPEGLRRSIDERLEMADWDIEQCWKALEESARRMMPAYEIDPRDPQGQRLARIIEALSRHGEQAKTLVLSLLERDRPENGRSLLRWLEPQFAELVGRLQLEPAIPTLIGYLSFRDNDVLSDVAADALAAIGTDSVVHAIAALWPMANDVFHMWAAFTMNNVHSDLCVETCRELLAAEADKESRQSLSHALLGNFAFDGIELVRQELSQGDVFEWDFLEFDLARHLLVAAEIMEVKFPEYKRWRLAMNDPSRWEWYRRLNNELRPGLIAPTPSTNGRHGDDGPVEDDDEPKEESQPGPYDDIEFEEEDDDDED